VNQRYEKSQQYVGIDLHRRRSVIVRMDGEGEVLECVRVDNSVPALIEEVGKAGPGSACRWQPDRTVRAAADRFVLYGGIRS
jgi:hypothetical protein